MDMKVTVYTDFDVELVVSVNYWVRDAAPSNHEYDIYWTWNEVEINSTHRSGKPITKKSCWDFLNKRNINRIEKLLEAKADEMDDYYWDCVKDNQYELEAYYAECEHWHFA